MIEALFMLFSALVGEYYRDTITGSIYISSLITLLAGGGFVFAGRKRNLKQGHITKREVFLTVTMAWIALALFGTLPYVLSDAIPSFTNAFFESMCGFTTTGNSTLTDLESFPRSLHFWRSFTQWMGGIGIIIFAMSLMPIFGGGLSGQFFDAEATGIAVDQVRPRVKEVARNMFLTYTGLTLVGFLLLLVGPMDAFDAACHALSSISTGGFSTRQEGLIFTIRVYRIRDYGMMFLGEPISCSYLF